MNKMINNKKSAFTLIELLVVISIVGLVSVLSIVALSGARTRARDAQRYYDLGAIKKALDLYYLENGEYPDETTSSANFETSDEDDFMEYLSEFLSHPPVDPINSGTMRYFYWKNNLCPSGDAYILGVQDLELEEYPHNVANPKSSVVSDCPFHVAMSANFFDYVIGRLE